MLQNIAELRGGGPALPPVFARHIPEAARDAVRKRAVMLITVLVVALMGGALISGWSWGLAALAAALAANALAQGAVSVIRRRVIPGTWAGLALMLPPALWVLTTLPWQPGALLLGPVLAVPVLLLCWAGAARI